MKTGVKPNPGAETLFSYEGSASDQSIDYLLQLAEDKLIQQNTDRSTHRKVFKILIETLQNTYLHLDKPHVDQGHSPVHFSLRKDKYHYTVSVGNHVRKCKVGALRGVLDRYNAMSIPELKKYYLAKLSKGQFSLEGGAGLGLVDIIYKSGKKISYSFKPVNKDYSYFSLQVKVSA